MSDYTRAKAGINLVKTGSPLAATATTVRSGPCRLFGVYVNTVMSAHTIAIQDHDSGSPTVTTTIVTIPASSAAGAMYNFPGIEFSHSMRVLSNVDSTGVITVIYKNGTAASQHVQG